MTRYIAEDLWRPVGVESLEPAADAVVRSKTNHLVVAGPGAGKSELLAQRANFLLETGRCPSPKRILAISFKRDAAKNLRDRVRKRCGDRADRFDSFTLDAFAKGLVDRFLPALAEDWRPHARYEVRMSGIPNQQAREWLLNAPVPDGKDRPDPMPWNDDKVRRIMDALMHGCELPYDEPSLNPYIRTWGLHWWREQLAVAPGKPGPSFPMLSRLAAFLLRTNPKIVAALRETYSHVFLDEFQDTTSAQWDLVRSALQGSAAVTTAVGDGKQRIMVWAGAKTDIFERFQGDFAATVTALVRNYRSVPELVEIQHVIALAVDSDAAKPDAARVGTKPGVCAIQEYRSPEQEAADIAGMIASEIAGGHASPRDFCVLARQQPGDMIALLASKLKAFGIKIRDESKLQELKAEPVAAIVIASLRLATRSRDAAAWVELLSEVAAVSGLDIDEDALELERLATAHRDLAKEHLSAGLGFAELPIRLLDQLGADRYRATYRQYASGDYLAKVAAELGDALAASFADTGDVARVVDDFIGTDVIPAMTIHKSKGLEFKTVIFMGLEDGQWRGFRAAPEEEKRAFFVAFSRAIERVVFTWSDLRVGKFGPKRQLRKSVGALHEILGRAGVPTLDKRLLDVRGHMVG